MRRPLIGLACPSGYPSVEDLRAGIATLEDRGYRVRLGPVLSRKVRPQPDLFAAAPLRERLADFVDVLGDEQVDAVILAAGGEGAVELLPGLETAWPTRRPMRKIPLMGFSDSTSLLWWAWRRGAQSIYGPSLCGKVGQEDESVLAKSLDLLEHWDADGRSFRLDGAAVVRGKKVCGRAVPACLSPLRGLIGTPFAPIPEKDLAESILFLEDGGIEVPGALEALWYEGLTHLVMAGLLRGVRGIVVGEIELVGEYVGPTPDIWSVLRHCLGKQAQEGPVWAGAQFGHAKMGFPIPFGVETELTCRATVNGQVRFGPMAVPWPKP